MAKQADIKVNITSNADNGGLTSARGALDNFRTSIGNAEGAGGKLKAGWTAATDTVRANAGLLAVAGGAALVGFATKAVGAFTDTAKAALDLGVQTGLSTEEASRWIAVGDDFKVSAGDLAGGLGKITKTLDDTKWAEYGIETRDASGEARSANDILLDSLTMLSGVKNATEQARIGNELFGKGYQNLTPLLGHTRQEYEKMLGTVEDGQVITSGEAAKAEKWRLAQDKLSDAFGEFALALGEVISEGAPVIDFLADAVTLVSKLGGGAGASAEDMKALDEGLAGLGKGSHILDLKVMNGLFDDSASAINQAKGNADIFGDALTVLAEDAEQVAENLANETFNKILKDTPEFAQLAIDAKRHLLETDKEMAEQQGISTEILDKWQKKLDATEGIVAGVTKEEVALAQETVGLVGDLIAATDATKDLTTSAGGLDKGLRDDRDAAVDAAAAIRDAEAATRLMDDAYSKLTGKLDEEEAWITAQEAIDTYKWKMADGTSTQKEQEAALRETIKALGSYVEGLDGVSPEVKTDIYAALNSGNITLAQTMIAAIPKDVTAHITADSNKAAMHQVGLDLDDVAKPRTVLFNPKLTPIKGAFASGTDSAPAGIGLVGEAGPELVLFGGGETVVPAGKTRSMLSGGGASTNIIINLPPGISAEAVLKAQRRAVRRGLS